MVGRICEPETHSVGGRGRALSRTVNVRDGSFTSVWPRTDDFRSTPVNGHSPDRRACLKGANNGQSDKSGFELLAHPDQMRTRSSVPLMLTP